ncbi:hypothetical protein AB6A40_005656 [Gnathostoma spinigerum]|uniref:BRCT domain-containing protein n=1 Tax=Gnathostoma spinigerum TaxID=75299 RepID=A0ABD6EQI5_9BILA
MPSMSFAQKKSSLHIRSSRTASVLTSASSLTPPQESSTPTRSLFESFVATESEGKIGLHTPSATTSVSVDEPPGQARTEAIPLKQSKVLEGVVAFVDLNSDEAFAICSKLLQLGAAISPRFSGAVTHLIFWKGHQDVIDRAQHRQNKPFIVAPHWVTKCFDDNVHVSEEAYSLYGLSNLALPLHEMAMARIGSVGGKISRERKKRRGSSREISDRSPPSSGDEGSFRSSISLSEVTSTNTIRETPASQISPTETQLVYELDVLTDHLTTKLTSPPYNQNLNVIEIISPIIERAKQRIHELSFHGDAALYSNFETPPGRQTIKKFVSIGVNTSPRRDITRLVQIDSDYSPEILLESSPENNENLISSNSMRNINPEKCLVTDDNRDSPENISYRRRSIAITGISEASAADTVVTPTSKIASALQKMQINAQVDSSTLKNDSHPLGSSKLASMSAPSRRRGRPLKTADELADYGPVEFRKYMLRHAHSTATKAAWKMSTQQIVKLYRKQYECPSEMTDKCPSTSRKCGVTKVRPVAIRTCSKVLNDMQIIPSSEEFVKTRPRLKKPSKRSGTIVMSALDSYERETILSIVRHLGVFSIANRVNGTTKYVISNTDGSRTLNTLHAVVRGIPVVSVEWAFRSVESGSWLRASEYLIPKWKKSYKAHLKNRSCRLFSAVGNMYISPKCRAAKDIDQLVRKCGGKVTDSVKRAPVIVAPCEEWDILRRRICSSMNLAHMVSDTWIFDCITEHKIIPFPDHE